MNTMLIQQVAEKEAGKLRSYAELLRDVMKDPERAEVYERLADRLESITTEEGGAGG